MSEQQQKGLTGWIDNRLPVFTFMRHSLQEYPTPKNLSYWWSFGSLAGIILVMMIISGIFLAMHYVPHVDHAFDSVDRIMREVNSGWLIRNLHVNGASMFFIVVYIHIFRGLYYGSYKSPREILWILGVVILLLMMATAFMGYVLPWGQMSFWGATVITNLFSAIPIVGEDIVQWLWGGYSVDNPTLNRFFSLHYLFPFMIVGVVILHLIALHQHGSNNPLGIDLKSKKDKIPFHPYYTIKDLYGFGVFLIIYLGFVCFSPEFFGEPDNYIEADPLVTPPHIVPEWYFLPFYAILRSVPFKLGGVLLMFAAVFVLMLLPWLDRSKIRSATFRPMFKFFFWTFLLDCILLGYAGSQAPEGNIVILGQLSTAYYFIYFLVILPLLPKFEKTRPLPQSISEPVLKRSSASAVCLLIAVVCMSGVANASSDAAKPAKVAWSFDSGIMGSVAGKFDRASLQRGFQVYKEVCAACHSLEKISYRHLYDIGLSEGTIKALAADIEVADGFDDEGEVKMRPGKPSDKLPSPYSNIEQARAANNGAAPPDLSLMAKARVHGPDYVYALLTGYQDAPKGFEMLDGLSYNKYFPGHQIAMLPPLSDDLVSFSDGTPANVEQMAKDVVTFLSWTADPTMEKRKQSGLKIILFLLFLTVLLYFLKINVWKKLKTID
jgi:ubiquinol-cytochrome c reductase cytochrome b/c1 subunit